MNATMQTLIVLLLVLAAAAYVGRKAWAALRPKKTGAGCDAGCGCGPETSTTKDWAKS